MLHAITKGTGEVTLVLMHFLGGSAREWDEVVDLLGAKVRTVAVDLPGFGGSADVQGYSVTQMADAVEDLIRSLHPGRYVLVGHSMSGKVCAVLARRAADRALNSAAHADPLDGLEGLVLVAPSPPSPEPMADGKREQMLANLGAVKHDDRERARAYITKREERDIPEAVLERAVHELLRMDRAAWVAWVEQGSKEDWSERVGVLDLPVMVVAGERDSSLGPEQQRALTMPHLSRARLCIVPNCSHLVPMEKPHEMTALLQEFLADLSSRGLSVEAPWSPALSEA